MAFFDKLKEKAAQGLDKAKDLGDQAKLTVQKEAEQKKIKGAYAAIGKLFAEEHMDLVKEFCGDQAEVIEAAKAEIEKITAMIAEKKADAKDAAEEVEEKLEDAAEAVEDKVEEVVEAIKED